MTIARSLLLGSAAGFAVISAAQAADLPVTKAAPVEYVRVCSAHGAGFFYIPGSDTCIKFAGRVRADYTYAQPRGGDVVVNGVVVRRNGRDQNVTGVKARARLDVDARTATDYGTLRAFFRFQVDKNSGQQGATHNPTLDKAYIQWAGITAGRAQSFFDFYASDLNWGSGYLASLGSDTTTELLAYTATFGSGFSATLSVEDRNTRNVNALAYQVAGSRMPDVVGVLRADQAWGSAQLSAALHQMNTIALSNPFAQRVNTEYGWAVQGGVNFKLDSLAAGDKLWLQAAYADGALSYVGMGPSISSANFVARAYDGLIVNNSIKSTKGWNVTGAFLHYWTPSVRQTVWGSYSAVDYANTVKYANRFNTDIRDFNAWAVGSNVIWSPVKAFDIGVEVLYTKAEKSAYRAANDVFLRGRKSEDAVQGRLRLQRDF